MLTAVRDAESRLMFVGYDQLWFKLFVWTLSAVLCGIAGALYVPQVGIINPGEMSPPNSIEMVIWVATGGRGTLIGPIIGAFAVNGLKSWLTTTFPEIWLYALGLVFVLVTLFLPQGIVGLFRKLVRAKKPRPRRSRPTRRRAPAAEPPSALPATDASDARRWCRDEHRRDRLSRESGPRPTAAFGDGEASYGRVAGEGVDTTSRRDPLSRRDQRQLRRLQGAEPLTLDIASANCAASSDRTAPARRR